MGGKIFLFFCWQTLLLKVISSRSITPDIPDCIGLGPAPYFYGPACGLGASSSRGFQVTSYSPLTPTGLTIFSENVIEGPVFVCGLLPFLSAVSLGGTFPSAGVGTILYGCGDEAIGIDSEGLIAAGAGPTPFFGQGFGYGHDPFSGFGMSYEPGLTGYGGDSFFGPGMGFGLGLPLMGLNSLATNEFVFM